MVLSQYGNGSLQACVWVKEDSGVAEFFSQTKITCWYLWSVFPFWLHLLRSGGLGFYPTVKKLHKDTCKTRPGLHQAFASDLWPNGSCISCFAWKAFLWRILLHTSHGKFCIHPLSASTLLLWQQNHSLYHCALHGQANYVLKNQISHLPFAGHPSNVSVIFWTWNVLQTPMC